ncbi:MAG: rRNA maturation RNase YbeY [Gemmatimonadales bacterium]|jgi:probable rRNA maturation factor|nr:MAG: rRNA maturation RNase YbeY [Gemmatimonadales bacterium]
MVEVHVASGGRTELDGPLEAAVRLVLSHHRVDTAEVSLALLGDEAIQALNRDHLGHDYPTDVLSFALWEEGEPVVGDVYLGYEQALRQADAEGVPDLEELLRLAIHGTLHVLGYEHPEEAASRPSSEMYRLQEALLRDLLSR